MLNIDTIETVTNKGNADLQGMTALGSVNPESKILSVSEVVEILAIARQVLKEVPNNFDIVFTAIIQARYNR